MKDSEKKTKNKESFFTKISKYTDLSLRSDKGFQLDIYAEKSGYKSVVTYNVKRIEKDEYILFTFRGEKSILYLYSNTRGKMKKYIIQYRRFSK